MAATFDWNRDTGTQTGSPTKGTTRSTSVVDTNWKSTDTYGTAYTAAPIVDGTNSFEIWNFGVLSGTWNNISAGLFAHTATALGAGLILKGVPACTTTSGVAYTTPSATANASLTTIMTSAIAIASGVAVWFGITGPEAANKAATVAVGGGATVYTNYLATQLQTSGAGAGDTATVTLTLSYNEN